MWVNFIIRILILCLAQAKLLIFFVLQTVFTFFDYANWRFHFNRIFSFFCYCFLLRIYSIAWPSVIHRFSIETMDYRWIIDGLSMDNLPCYCLQTYCLFWMKKCVRKSQKLGFGKIDGKKRKYIQWNLEKSEKMFIFCPI